MQKKGLADEWPALFAFDAERAREENMNGTAVLTHVFERPLRAFRQDPPLCVPGDFTLAHYISAYTDPLTYQLLFNSFVFATGSSILATFLAATLAWISIRTNAPFRKFFELIAIVPNIFPPVMLAVSWTVLLSPRTGLINRILMQMLSLDNAPLNLYSLSGMIFVEALITTPLA